MNPFAEQAVYAQIGEEGFAELTAAFYSRVSNDDILRPLYEQARRETGEPDMSGAELRLREFLVQRFGGPSRYSEARGHPRLRMRHMPYAIDEAARDRWLKLMDESLAETGIEEPALSAMRAVFAHVAEFMRNR
ncbi:MAG: globin [Phycisphaerales bacterium]|nr:globin [Phycisphaerales bacterium]MCB9836536.1 globin [Phycisphaera sp.]